jgi:glycosyltransferase involved in cell wall biosynthesis
MTSPSIQENVKPVCSIVIRCCNEEKHLGNLLTGILAQNIKNVEIILVDSGSTDATLAIASQHPVKILQIMPEDFSFGYSLNLGCAHATADLIVIASAHVYPLCVDWLEKILEPFSDPDVALVYGKQRGDLNACYAEQQIYRKWYPEHDVNHQQHPFCNNANAAIRKSVWTLFPYNIELTGLEDLDWARRALDSGRKIVYSARAEIIHVHNESSGQILNRYRREAIAYKRIYPNEKFSLFDFAILFTANAASDLFHAMRDKVTLRHFAFIVLFRFMQFWGTYRGYSQKGFVTKELSNRFYYPHRLFKSCQPTPPERGRLIHYD